MRFWRNRPRRDHRSRRQRFERRVCPTHQISSRRPCQSAERCRVTKDDSYDILVLGSGESGKYLAWTMAAAGHRTAVIERKLIGGSCPNVACLPSKNIIHSAKVKSLALRASEFGFDTGRISTDMKVVQERKRRMV